MIISKRFKVAWQAVQKQIVLMIIALAAVSLFLAISKYDPFAIFNGLYRAFTLDIAGTIRWATPLILAGLAVCIPFKANVFNLGVDGQIYMGAIGATLVGLFLPVNNSLIGIVTIFIAAMLAGALFALIPAAMKVYFNADIVVTTLMLNFVALLFTEYMVADVLRDPQATVQLNASKILDKHLWLPKIEAFMSSSVNIGIFIALFFAGLIAFLFYKTTLGYEIKLVGTNSDFAKYGGIKPKLVTMKVMAISGAIGGVIGAIEVTAIQHRLSAGFNPSFGFDGIVVSLLANNNPLGVILSGIFFGALKNAGMNMERTTDVPQVVTQIVMAIIILTISANIVIKKLKAKKEVAK